MKDIQKLLVVAIPCILHSVAQADLVTPVSATASSFNPPADTRPPIATIDGSNLDVNDLTGLHAPTPTTNGHWITTSTDQEAEIFFDLGSLLGLTWSMFGTSTR